MSQSPETGFVYVDSLLHSIEPRILSLSFCDLNIMLVMSPKIILSGLARAGRQLLCNENHGTSTRKQKLLLSIWSQQ